MDWVGCVQGVVVMGVQGVWVGWIEVFFWEVRESW